MDVMGIKILGFSHYGNLSIVWVKADDIDFYISVRQYDSNCIGTQFVGRLYTKLDAVIPTCFGFSNEQPLTEKPADDALSAFFNVLIKLKEMRHGSR